jgi:hypothetical protein
VQTLGPGHFPAKKQNLEARRSHERAQFIEVTTNEYVE